MEEWLESVYSDGSADFVSNPAPALGETVQIRLRCYADAPVRSVMLRTVPNGADVMIPMLLVKKEQGLLWWQAELKMTERRMQYQFYLASDKTLYFYTQKGVTSYLPDQSFDFVLAFLELFLEVSPNLAFGGEFVLLLLLGRFHYDIDGVTRVFVGSGTGVHVDQLVTFLSDGVEPELVVGDGEGEESVVGIDQYGGASLNGYSGSFEPLAGNELSVDHAAFGLHKALLGLGGGEEACQQNAENEDAFHGVVI